MSDEKKGKEVDAKAAGIDLPADHRIIDHGVDGDYQTFELFNGKKSLGSITVSTGGSLGQTLERVREFALMQLQNRPAEEK